MRLPPTFASRSRLLLLLAVALAAGLGALGWRATRATAPAVRELRSPAAVPARDSAKRSAESPLVEPTSAGPLPAVRAEHFDERRLERALADFQAQTVYPPTSSPHSSGTSYKLRWNEPFIDDAPLESDTGEPTGESTYRFGVDRAHVAPGETLISWLEVRDGAALVPISVTDAFVELSDGSGRRLVALEYNDEGRDGDAVAGDRRYTHRLAPSQLPALARPRHVHLAATVSTSRKRARVSRVFTYATRSPLAVRAIRDEVRRGSLALLLELDVTEAGLYTFEGNLLSADGRRPVAWVKQSFRLAEGKREVELLVHGRIFHDAAADGPYLLRDLRALLRSERPDEAPLLWSEPRPHLTRQYARDDFSRDEWTSPYRQAQLDRLQRLRDEAAAGAPSGAPPSRHIVVDERGVEHSVPGPGH